MYCGDWEGCFWNLLDILSNELYRKWTKFRGSSLEIWESNLIWYKWAVEKCPSQVKNLYTTLRIDCHSSLSQDEGIPHLQSTMANWGFEKVEKSPILMVFFLYHFSPDIGSPATYAIKDSIILNLKEPMLTCLPSNDCANARATP